MGTVGGKFGCGAAVVAGLPVFGLLMFVNYYGDCAGDPRCEGDGDPVFWIILAVTAAVAATAGLGVRALVNRLAGSGPSIAAEPVRRGDGAPDAAPPEREEAACLLRPDGRERVLVYRRRDGRFEFVVEALATELDAGIGLDPGYWYPVQFSGLHDSLAGARREAAGAGRAWADEAGEGG